MILVQLSSSGPHKLVQFVLDTLKLLLMLISAKVFNCFGSHLAHPELVDCGLKSAGVFHAHWLDRLENFEDRRSCEHLSFQGLQFALNTILSEFKLGLLPCLLQHEKPFPVLKEQRT
jgi:hypothetical protein